ncbi:phenylalanyl-tRNA synthetase beta subunit [Kitasatospora sp. GAS204A]|uniref:phenylalanine--tRNA ligase subunit beta-related protein n=1 Tax=unclassified Kitasatospora TaxID=2633591 RepID=UPI0024749C0F|nr:hypothetical protein [Kitasatospora sp. GAS204B]MDH6118595.1 phenylalanyl-tRNA synthetase beta subunit [Kitasatospora sp. GAS204B]
MRIPLSWLTAFLGRELSARTVDDLLGEAGVTVTAVEPLGLLHPRVVAARVLADPDGTGRQLTVAVPEPQVVELPGTLARRPAPGDVVAVALAGARLLAPVGAAAPDVLHGVRKVAAARRGAPGGRLCGRAELGLDGGDDEPCPLPADAALGEPVHPLLPDGRREEILHVKVPAELGHCRGLWGLAVEISARAGFDLPEGARLARSEPCHCDRPVPGPALPLTVAEPGLQAAAALLAGLPADLRLAGYDGRLALAGIAPAEPAEGFPGLRSALRIAQYEYGVRLRAHPVAAGGSVTAVTMGGPADDAAAALPGELPVPWPERLGVRIDSGAGPGHRDAPAGLLIVAVGPAGLALGGAAPTSLAVARVVALLREAAPQVGRPAVAQAEGPEIERRELLLDVEELTGMLGASLSRAECRSLLLRIGATAREVGERRLLVAVPPFRPDLSGPAELATELARLHGYRALPDTVPSDPVAPRRDRTRVRREAARDAVARQGFHEVVSPAVRDGTVPEELRTDAPHWYGRLLPVLGPGQPGQAPQALLEVRRSLLPGLLAAATANLRLARGCALFEAGTVVLPEQTDRPEASRLAVLLGRVEATASDRAELNQQAVREVAGALRAAVRAAGLTGFTLVAADFAGFQPGSGALVLVDDAAVGRIGVLHPRVARAAAGAGRSFAAAELDLDALLAAPERPPLVTPPPRFPAVEQDLTFLLPGDLAVAAVLAAVQAATGPLLRGLEVRSVYRGPQLPAGLRALTVRLSLGSERHTPARHEVDDACARATGAAAGLGAVRRAAAGGDPADPEGG